MGVDTTALSAGYRLLPSANVLSSGRPTACKFGGLGQCLSQELKKVRHMSRQAEKGETYVSPS